ncbi:DUF6541 family protein [Arthrobacter sp. SLBN-112]|uniref:DUF6541 family protein n=1 Tax=Arthrobacter sp. SLBN-112 TaxID=2768452 RepID=UPI0027B0805B|nr:DUF6541 family protein [Arthrobacter sp. SLBN-112]MDQ0800391.1 putative integral membrane protein [Arthrobacter sp. SLBN-112]
MYAMDGLGAECRNLGNTDELLGESLISWLAALPGFGVASAVLLLPGLVFGWALGLRRIWMMSLAPVLTASLVAVSTLVCWWVHVDWQLGAFTVSVAVCAGVALVLVRAGAKLWPKFFSWDRGEERAGRAYWIALLASAIFLALRYAQIVEDPANINQGIDTPFHLNLVQQIIDSRDGSPFSVRGLMGETAGFYPQIWHALAALVAEATGLPVVEAANALNFAVVALAWPIGVLFLVKVVVGPKMIALLSAGIASAGFFAFPFTVMQSQKSDFGPLFPYMLAVTFLAPLLTVWASLLGFGRDPIPWPLGLTTLLAGLPGLVITHMSALVALVGLTSGFTAMAAVHSFRKLRQVRSGPFPYLQWIALWTSAFFFGLIVWAGVRPWTTTWDPIDTFPGAVGSVLEAAPTHGDVSWGLAALTLLGTAVLFGRPCERWFLAAYGGAVALYLVAASVPQSFARQIVIGAWYGDPPRLAALLPMFWAVFVGLAATWFFENVASSFRVKWLVAIPITAVAAATIMWPTNSQTTPGRERTYALSGDSPLVSPDELKIMRRLSSEVPEGAVMANNPWDGSSTAYAIANRRVLFPHAYTGSNADRLLLAETLNRATPGSEACAAAKRENVQFLLDFGDHYIDPLRTEVNDFPGISVPANSPAFVKVDQQGSAVLYRFVGCDL